MQNWFACLPSASVCIGLPTLRGLEGCSCGGTGVAVHRQSADRHSPQWRGLVLVICSLPCPPPRSCGVCQFDGRLCSKLYPGERRTEALLDMLRPLGLRFEVGSAAAAAGNMAAAGCCWLLHLAQRGIECLQEGGWLNCQVPVCLCGAPCWHLLPGVSRRCRVVHCRTFRLASCFSAYAGGRCG